MGPVNVLVQNANQQGGQHGEHHIEARHVEVCSVRPESVPPYIPYNHDQQQAEQHSEHHNRV